MQNKITTNCLCSLDCLLFTCTSCFQLPASTCRTSFRLGLRLVPVSKTTRKVTWAWGFSWEQESCINLVCCLFSLCWNSWFPAQSAFWSLVFFIFLMPASFQFSALLFSLYQWLLSNTKILGTFLVDESEKLWSFNFHSHRENYRWDYHAIIF